ncbi:hypothetical protein Moror_5302 [Moniliophthora roreri MCA 2997]|uniref:Uncharacterized protein n=1 Tax=Moniliophthora roreri (strain MCA 2997) TaxID=1381753 RepID=V2X5N5_MONRO|nr:hypothetical protein Moror_5302 [Moniliophthora roreri MCA 2997]
MTFFKHSYRPFIRDSHFTFVQGNQYNDSTRPSSSTDGWPDSVNNFTTIKLGDLKFIECRKRLEYEMQIKDDSPASERQDTNPFRVQIREGSKTCKAIKVIRTVHTAQIAGRESELFTVVKYEDKGGSATNALAACKSEYEYWSQKKHAKFPQLFGVTYSSIPALIYYNARANAIEVLGYHNKCPTVWIFLLVLYIIDCREACTAMPELFKMDTSFSSWDFDFSTRSFYYNLDFPINKHVKTRLRSSSRRNFIEDARTLDYFERPQISPPALDNRVESRPSIINYLSRITEDYLDLIATLGVQSNIVDPLEIALDGLIPFGACFQKRWGEKRGLILASFQYRETVTNWGMEPTELDVNPSYVNSHVRISFLNWQQGGDFKCSVTIAPPMDQKRRFRCAFLSQSLVFMKRNGINFESFDECYLLDSVVIDIQGRFKPLPGNSTSADPIYLFIGPFEFETVDGIPCLKRPLNGSFAHWSLDPSGPGTPIDAGKYGLSQFEENFSVGVFWDIARYMAVEEYLRFKEYDPYSTAHAEDQEYPLLTYRNKPGQRLEEVTEARNDSNRRRRMKKIGLKIKRFLDSLARRKKRR